MAGMLFWNPWSIDDSELWVSNSTIVMYNMSIVYNKNINVCSHHRKVFFKNEDYKICYYFCDPRFYSVVLINPYEQIKKLAVVVDARIKDEYK